MSNLRDRSASLWLAGQPVYHLENEKFQHEMNVSPSDGLTSEQVLESRKTYGSNALQQVKPKNPFLILLGQLVNSVTIILYACFIITMVNKQYIDGTVIMCVVLGNATLGFVQDMKAEASLVALQKLSTGSADVVRDGTTLNIPIDEVVVGDIIMLKSGTQCPADGRVIESRNLLIDEALLTGESNPVNKHTNALPMPALVNNIEVGVALGDRANMIFRQTSVVGGSGLAVITNVGTNTKVGQLSKKLQSGGDELTPMQKNMQRFLYFVFGASLMVAFIIFAIDHFRFGKETILYACAAGIAIFPESLIAVVTITLAIATNRMAAQNAIVRKLAAVETLGTVTNICSDKTGTLTENKMVVKKFYIHGSPYVYHVSGGAMDATAGFGIETTDIDGVPIDMQICPRARASSRAVDSYQVNTSVSDRTRLDDEVLNGVPESEYGHVQVLANDLAMVCGMCNNTTLQYDKQNDTLIGNGSATELALQVFAFKTGLPPNYFTQEEQWEVCGEWPFESSVKSMSVGLIRNLNSEKIVIGHVDEEAGIESLVLTKGAPEVILPYCVDVDADRIMNLVNRMAAQGYRVLACSIGSHLSLRNEEGRRLHDIPRAQVNVGLKFVGLCMVFDPPRAESAHCVQMTREAGITFHMVTGDHYLTAENISRKIGILRDCDDNDRILTGPVFDAMTNEQIDDLPELPLVIARCSPESKVKLVEAIHRRSPDNRVAMTGDGFNDAPAIKIADVGVAMGITGVDVTKNVADIILADDNIATLVSAVSFGRATIACMRSFINLLLTGNYAEVVVLLFGLVFTESGSSNHFVEPISTISILWINAVSALPSLALAYEETDPNAMKRNPDGSVFNRYVYYDVLAYGTLAAICSFASYLAVLGFQSWDIGFNCGVVEGLYTCNTVWEARAVLFATMNLILLLHGYVVRSTHDHCWTKPFLSNKVLFTVVVINTTLLFPIIYIPVIANNIFKHTYITWQWSIVLIAVLSFLAGTEVWKIIKRYFRIDLHDLSVVVAHGDDVNSVGLHSSSVDVKKGKGYTNFIDQDDKVLEDQAQPDIEMAGIAPSDVPHTSIPIPSEEKDSEQLKMIDRGITSDVDDPPVIHNDISGSNGESR